MLLRCGLSFDELHELLLGAAHFVRLLIVRRLLIFGLWDGKTIASGLYRETDLASRDTIRLLLRVILHTIITITDSENHQLSSIVDVDFSNEWYSVRY